MGFKRLYASLLAELQLLPASVNRAELLRALQGWLQRSLGEWAPEARESYGLAEWASLDLSNYPIDDASLVAAEELQQLRAIAPVSIETLAMRVRDIFWEGITVESSIQCPRCNGTALRVLEDTVAGDIVLACDLCAWAQTAYAAPWSEDRRLRPARNELVAAWRQSS